VRSLGKSIPAYVGRTNQTVSRLADSVSPGAAMIAAGIALAIFVGAALADENWFRSGMLMFVALIPMIMRWPIIVPFGLYAFLLPFDTIQAGFGMTLTRPIGLLAIVVLAAASVVERRLRRPPPAAVLFGVLLIWASATAAWAVDSALVYERLPTLVGISLLYILAVCVVPSRRELQWLYVLTVIGGTTAAAIASIFGSEDRQGRVSLALNEQLANANLFTAGLVTAVALALGGAVALRGRLPRMMSLGAAAAIVLAIAISGSRSTFVAVVLMVLFLMYRMGFTTKILVPAVALSILVWLISDTLMDRIGLLFTGEDSTGSGRTDIWSVGLRALGQFGIWGAGLGTFPHVYRMYEPLGPRIVPPSAHNSYLQLWTELGIVGVVLLLAIVVTQIRRVYMVRKAGADGIFLVSLEAACIGSVFLAFFGDIVWTKQFWWPWILLAWATSRAREAAAASATLPGPSGDSSAPPVSLASGTG
jgi:O-antigen ligase